MEVKKLEGRAVVDPGERHLRSSGALPLPPVDPKPPFRVRSTLRLRQPRTTQLQLFR